MADSDITINTGGGASTGNVETGRDFIGRDQTNININMIDWPTLSTEFVDDLHSKVQYERKRLVV
jgi:hypothetical protein